MAIVMERMVSKRCESDDDDDVNGILGNTMSESRSIVCDGEMYLRSLYLPFKQEGVEGSVGDVWAVSKYIGSRQQCMYACFCLVVTFFTVCDSVLVCEMDNFEWFHGTVMQKGCASILEDNNRRLHRLDDIHCGENISCVL